MELIVKNGIYYKLKMFDRRNYWMIIKLILQYDINGTEEEKCKLFSVPDFIGFACKQMGKCCEL